MAALTWLLVKEPLLTKLPKADSEYSDLIEKLQTKHGAVDGLKGSAVRQKLRHLFETHGAGQGGYVASSVHIVRVMAGVAGAMPTESGSAASSESSASDAQAGSRMKGLLKGPVSPMAAPSEPPEEPTSNWTFGSGIALMKSDHEAARLTGCLAGWGRASH